MPQDAFTLRFIAGELNENLSGGKISRINQPSKDGLILLIYTRKGTVKLTLDFSAKFCRASLNESGVEENPQIAPGFCMLLRKHLQNAEITGVYQAGFERVLYIDFKCFSEFEITDMRLYLEIMGKYSNAILTKDGVIVGALKCVSLESAKRVTLSGARYRLPDRQDKADPTNLAELERAFDRRCGDAAEFISSHVAGIAYVTATDIVKRYGEGVTAAQVYGYVNSSECRPCVTGQDFKARYSEGAAEFSSVLEAQSAFYSRETGIKSFADKKRKLTATVAAAIKKVEKRLALVYDKLEECKKADDIKLKGELITANIYAVQRGMTRLEVVNYYDPAGSVTEIELDPRLTPSQNAQRYYKKYAKLKRTAEYLNEQKSREESALAYLKTVLTNLELAETAEDFSGTESELISLSLLPAPPKKKGAKPKEISHFRTYIFNGFKVLCGRNNTGNDALTRGLSQGDIWLHTKTFHSSHVGIITDGKSPDEQTIKCAAEVCAYYSEARQKDKVPVDYTLKKYVKKPNGANSGFVVYTDFKTLLVTPDKHKENATDE